MAEALSITAAAMIMQFSVILIMSVATFILWSGEPPVPIYPGESESRGAAPAIVISSLCTIGALLFSNEFANVWKPVIGASNFQGISWSWAIAIVFATDILWVAFMVVRTSGSISSPYTPVFFTLPPLAIFLREPLARVTLYLILIAAFFSVALSSAPHVDPARWKRSKRLAFWFVSLACFTLSTAIGYLTRPR